MCETILEKLEKFTRENSDRMEKASSHKFLTLLLNPLEESIKLLGNDSSLLPLNCCARVTAILAKMKGIFRSGSESSKSSNPPASLVESYIELNLLIDSSFQTTGKLQFETYFKLFMEVKSLQARSGV